MTALSVIISAPDDDRAALFAPQVPANNDDALVAKILRSDDAYHLCFLRRVWLELDGEVPEHIAGPLNKRIAELS